MANNTKDLEQLIKLGRQQGWTVTKTNGGHWKWMHPLIETAVFTSATPSDWRMIRNHAAIMARVARLSGITQDKQPSSGERRYRQPKTKLHVMNRSPVLD